MCQINQGLAKEVDQALGPYDTYVYNRFYTCKSGEKQLQRLLRMTIELRGPNSLETAYVHHALGLACYNQATSNHSRHVQELFRRGDEHFVAAGKIYKCRTAAFAVAADHEQLLLGWARTTADQAASWRLQLRASDVNVCAQLQPPSPCDGQCQAVRTNCNQQSRFIYRPMPAPPVVPAATSAANPMVDQAVAAGLADLRAREAEAAQKLEADHTRQLADCARRAEETLASIPQLVRTKTAAKLDRAVVMTLEPLESEEKPRPAPLGFLAAHAPDPGKLRYAARLVYDRCLGAGLMPSVHCRNSEEGDGQVFVLSIRWTNPARS